jgi:hypothetical protein
MFIMERYMFPDALQSTARYRLHSLKVEKMGELGDCATFGDSPIYGYWRPHPDLRGNVSSNPLDAVFQYGVYVKPDTYLKSTPIIRKMEAKYVVSNIQHYAWYSNAQNTKANFRFHHYLSILSAQKFNKPDCVYFWYEKEPTGKLWELLKKKLPKLVLVYRESPSSIYGRGINVPEHRSDVVRLEAMLKYGGLYTDLDVIILKPFTDLRIYDTTMGYESAGLPRKWLCNGIIQAKANATFLRMWHEKYKNFNDAQWGEHSVYVPARLALKYPGLIHTEIDTFNRPNWEERNWLYNEGKIWNWTRSYAIHLWYRFHNKEHNITDIKTINTTMGELFRFIVYGKKDLIGKDENVTVFSL